MQALAVKFLIAIGKSLATKLVGLLWNAMFEAYTDNIVDGSAEKKEITQEERREVFKILEKSTDKEQRRHLMSVINKLR